MRFSKFETELQEVRSEIGGLRRANVDQNREINQLRGLVEELRGVFVNSEASQKTIFARVDEFEDRSRSNNLKFEGLSEDLRENWEPFAENVRKLIKEKLCVHGEVEIECAHRVCKFMSGKPRPVIAKFLRFTDKQNILRSSRKLKGTNVFINENLCKASMVKRRNLLPQLKQARGQGKIAYFSHTRLVIQDP